MIPLVGPLTTHSPVRRASTPGREHTYHKRVGLPFHSHMFIRLGLNLHYLLTRPLLPNSISTTLITRLMLNIRDPSIQDRPRQWTVEDPEIVFSPTDLISSSGWRQPART